MRNLDPLTTWHYLDKSEQFYEAMRLAADDVASYGASVALLAVHSSISLNDAVIVGLLGKKRSNQDHMIAGDQLEWLCNRYRFEDQKGVGHFRWLLGRKSDIAYGTRRLDPLFVNATKDRAERFKAWTYNHFREVLRASAGFDT